MTAGVPAEHIADQKLPQTVKRKTPTNSDGNLVDNSSEGIIKRMGVPAEHVPDQTAPQTMESSAANNPDQYLGKEEVGLPDEHTPDQAAPQTVEKIAPNNSDEDVCEDSSEDIRPWTVIPVGSEDKRVTYTRTIQTVKIDGTKISTVHSEHSSSGFLGCHHRNGDLHTFQYGKECTIVYLNINEKVIEHFKRNPNQDLRLQQGEKILTLVWSNDYVRKEKLETHFKIETLDHISTEVVKKITYEFGRGALEIAEEFSRLFCSKLKEISYGCLTFIFQTDILDGKQNRWKEECENMRTALAKKLDIIYDFANETTGEHFKVSILKVQSLSLFDPKNNIGTYVAIDKAEIEKLSYIYSTKAAHKAIHTLICVDISFENEKESLKSAFHALSKGCKKTLTDREVHILEYYSLVISTERGTYIGQCYESLFPNSNDFNDFIDNVFECPAMDRNPMPVEGLRLSFEICQKYGQTVSWNEYRIFPRIIFLTNGNVSKEKEESFLEELCHMKTSPVTILPVDKDYNSSFLQKIVKETGGEVTNDVQYISGFQKQQELILNAITKNKHDKNGILEYVKEHRSSEEFRMVLHLLDTRKDILEEIGRAVTLIQEKNEEYANPVIDNSGKERENLENVENMLVQ